MREDFDNSAAEHPITAKLGAMDLTSAARALLLVGVAGSLPWAAGRALGTRLGMPLDCGVTLWDGRRLLGSNKTWRGLAAGVLGCALAAPLMGLDVATGVGVGAAALLGDAFSSMVKRRFALEPGSEVAGLDQLPEVLLPLLMCADTLAVGAVEIAAVTAVFTLLDLLTVPLRHR